MSTPLAIWVSRTARALACCAIVACGTSATDSTSPRTSSVSGTITYAGPAAARGRPLAIAVYRSYPPKGPPVAWRLVDDYRFPYRYTFDDLPAGSYTVGALIDVDTADTRNIGQLNAARDPHGYAAGGRLLSVSEQHAELGADIALQDPQ